MIKLIIFFIFLSNFLFANPSISQVVNGDVKLDLADKNLTIQSSDKSIINWKDFSIKENELTKFILPNSNSSVLNKVVGKNISEILGKLESNGSVILINPNGILFGKDSIVKAASFTASTLDISNKDFLKNNFIFKELKNGSIINLGTINAKIGDVNLLAKVIENHGTINALNANVSIGSSTEILLNPSKEKNIFIKPDTNSKEEISDSNLENESSKSSILNTGQINCIKAELKASKNPYSYAIKNSGKISSFGILNNDGKVLLVSEGITEVSGEIVSKNIDKTGGKVHILGEKIGLIDNAIIDVSSENKGGEVLIGGDFQGKNPDIKNALIVYVGKDVKINANATQNGDGGKVILWSDESTSFLGDISAQGGNLIGNGGFIEVSSKGRLSYLGKANTSATSGKTGILLLDPSDITISDQNTNPALAAPFVAYDPGVTPATENTINIVKNADIVTSLGTNSVIISTEGGSKGSGDIQILSDVSYSSLNDLIFRAEGKFIVKAQIQNLFKADISVFANGDIEIGSSSSTVPCSIESLGNITIGAIDSGANHNLTLQAGSAASASAIILSAENLTFDVQRSFDNISLIGSSADNAPAAIGALGNIEFNSANISVGSLELTAGSGSGSYASISQNSSNIKINFASTSSNSVTLTGGGLNSYARIFSGVAGGNILFTGNISSLSLTGGSGNGSYSEINTQNGNIDFSGLTSETIALTGGSGTSSFAGIVSVIDNIDLGKVTNLSLTGGPASGSLAEIHAYTTGDVQINFDSTSSTSASLIGGGLNSYTRILSGSTSGDILFTGSLDSLSLTGGSGNGSYSEIFSQNGNVDFSGLTLETIALTGGNGPGSFAEIVTSTGNIDLGKVTNLTLTGGIGAGSFSTIYANTTGDIKINFDSTSTTSANLTGGALNSQITIRSGTTSGKVEFLGSLDSLSLNGGSGDSAYSRIYSINGDVDFSSLNLKSLVMNGGLGAGSLAEISTTTTGDVKINFASTSTTSANLTGGALNSQVTIRSGTTSGNVYFLGSLDSLSLNGGSGTNAYSSIHSENGNIDFSSLNLKSLSITGGVGTGALGEISTYNTGNIIMNFPSTSTVSLIGGGENSNASIISGTTSGNLLFTGNINSLTLEGSSANGSYSEINSQNGNVDISSLNIDSLSLTGGAGDGSYSQLKASNGAITTINTKSLSLIAGSGSSSPASIVQGVGSLSLNGLSGDVTLIGGGVNSNATITVPAGQNLTLNGQVGNFTLTGGSGVNAEAELVSTGSLILPYISGSLLMNGGVSEAKISTQGNDLSITTGNDISLNQNAILQITSGVNNKNILVRAGNDVNMISGASGLAQIVNNSTDGNVTIVCDNLFPNSPSRGNGNFLLSFGSLVNVNGNGYLKVYTASNFLNTIDGLLRNEPYVPGNFFVDSDTEVWGHYYPNSPVGDPYTIYYKIKDFDFPSDKKNAILSELLINLNSMSQYVSKYIEWYNFYCLKDLKYKKNFFIRKREFLRNYMQYPKGF